MKDTFLKILKTSSDIDWFITHKLSKEEFNNIKFSFVDGKERYDNPFKTNLGYISFKQETFLSEYQKTIKDLINELKANNFALANIYILITRTSYKKIGNNILEELFKKVLSEKQIKIIYKLLAKSLNKNYYSQLPKKTDNFESLNEWLEAFNKTSYLRDFSDTLGSILLLADIESFQKIEYEKIKIFNPLIRSRLISWYGTRIKIDKDELFELVNVNLKDASFFAALLIKNDCIPKWANEKSLNVFILKYWADIGKDLFLHIFGISYRNKNKSFSELKTIVHPILFKKLKTEDDFNKEWLNSLDFPNDFIALFNWIHENEVILVDMNDINKKIISYSLVNSMNFIAGNIPKYIASKNNYFPFKSHQLNENKYQISLSYILLFITTRDDTDFKMIKKKLNDLAFKIRPQYYGSYRSQYLAKNFTEILLLVLLSSINISNISEQIIKNLKSLLKIINNTILIPYIHLTEREEEIWNKDIEENIFQYNVGKYLINNYLKRIMNNENDVKECYNELFELFENVKVAEWIYER
jgi:uncharacterized membrane protein YgaE (UPF0421/DUF939 family)